jgi:tRNA(Ile)-lysidine synthase
VRPLLGLRREALRDFLRRNGTGWAEDPTNTNLDYERARVRARLAAEDADAGFRSAAAQAERRRIELGEQAAVILRGEAKRVAPGLIRLTRGFAKAEPTEAAAYAFRVLLAVAGGLQQLPTEERSAGLFLRLKGGPLRATLSRSVVDARASEIFIWREERGLPLPVPPYDGMIWDGRFRLKCAGGATSLKIAPLGAGNARTVTVVETGVPQSLARAALAAEPALWSKETCLGRFAGPSFRELGVEARPVAAPWAQFLPSFDLALARALAELLGCESVPGLPFRSTNLQL